MDSKVGKSRHRAVDIFPMHQGDQEHHGGQIKTKVCATVPETNDISQENYGSRKPKSIMYMG